jgi:hypothetical protein
VETHRNPRHSGAFESRPPAFFFRGPEASSLRSAAAGSARRDSREVAGSLRACGARGPQHERVPSAAFGKKAGTAVRPLAIEVMTRSPQKVVNAPARSRQGLYGKRRDPRSGERERSS